MIGYDLGRVATTNDVASGFSTSSIMGTQRETLLTLNNMQNYINQGFSGLNVQILNGVNDLSRQISDCCCTTQRAIDNVNFNMERNTCAITNTIKDEFCGLYKYLSNEKIESLRDKYNQALDEIRWLKEKDARNQQTGFIVGAMNNSCGCNNTCC